MKAARAEVKKGMVVQIIPHFLEGGFKPEFDACLAIVREVKSWGVKAYVPVPANPTALEAPVLLKWEAIELVGRCPFVKNEEEEP